MAKLEFNHRTLPQGYQLGDYVVEDLLGQGGFGIAYLAKDIHLHNHVVIKEYFPNEIVSRDGQTVTPFGTSGQDDFERGMQRFVEEGRALARFNHPAVVRILKYFQQNNTAYLVMEFIDGEPLDQYLKRKGTLTPEVVEHLANELLDGLAIVHQHGLIHRDIKPANIMLRPGGKPVLIDFGAAKDALAEKSHSVVVTAGYGALEQYSSKSQLTPATDLYALGGTLYKCLTGQTPEESSSRIIQDDHPVISSLSIAKSCSTGLVALIDQSMHIKQKDRLQSAMAAKNTLIKTKVVEEKKAIRTEANKEYLIAGMIEMASSTGSITHEEIDFIVQKAKAHHVDIAFVKSLINKMVSEHGLKILESKRDDESSDKVAQQSKLNTNAKLNKPYQPEPKINIEIDYTWTTNLWRWADQMNIPKYQCNFDTGKWVGMPRTRADLISLKELDLSNIKLNTLPKELMELTSLEYLNLYKCNLRSIPPLISNLKKLKSLNLNDNNLVSLPNEIGELSQLQTLMLRGNAGLSSLPQSLFKLTALEKLVMDGFLSYRYNSLRKYSGK
ncbi:protein kinase domain-containing protein [Thiomicrospira microaerophila]|uniref:protein kinase domain-containing protein n=1 Tax=Thiomicrospira microaerophila TaxID=406020 RepID=UPI000695CEFE|nr:protein kinase [Thiomicrospira microaerophila]